jgi:hypothetical protein
MSHRSLDPPADECLWQAYEYVSGELSADAEAAFEARLAEDQGLREVVARVVETCAAVRTVAVRNAQARRPPVPAALATDRAHRFLTTERVAGALAASLVFGLIAVQSGFWSRPPQGSTARANLAPPAGASGIAADRIADEWTDEIVAYWSAGAEEESRFADDGEPADDLAEQEFAAENTHESAEFVVPGWMLAAVAPSERDGLLETTPDDAPRPPSVEN